VVLCLNRKTGEEVWRKTATKLIPHEGAHGDNNFASASPTTDGERLYCWFGSAGLFCYDLTGKKLWERKLGQVRMGAYLGEGCSPVIHDGKLVIVRDHQRQSTIEVLNAKTGEPIWKKNRAESNTWATPVIVRHGGKTQVITTASGKVRSYDLANGDLIWQCAGLTGNAIPCPVVENGVVYCMSGYKGYSLLALPLTARGDITGTDKILWRKNRGTPYIPSPVLYDGLLFYSQSNQSLLTITDAKTGETHLDRERLRDVSNVYSSPVGANGKVYITGRNGVTLVLKRSKKLEILAQNKLSDRLDASPALAGNQLYLRGRRFLYCIGEK
jgi:outer membrane protein assembly factor BamB